MAFTVSAVYRKVPGLSMSIQEILRTSHKTILITAYAKKGKKKNN